MSFSPEFEDIVEVSPVFERILRLYRPPPVERPSGLSELSLIGALLCGTSSIDKCLLALLKLDLALRRRIDSPMPKVDGVESSTSSVDKSLVVCPILSREAHGQ